MVSIFNILLNIVIVFEIFVLAKHFFNKNIAYIAVILYCILPSNILLPQVHLTEIPFVAIILGALCFMRKNKYFSLFLAGVLLFIANWVRPVAIPFLLPILIYMFINRFNFKNYLFLLVPVVSLVLLIGFYNKHQTGYFIYQSTTGGFNLIEGANDNMNGGYEKTCYEQGNIGYIENIDNYSFAQRDSIWMARSVE